MEMCHKCMILKVKILVPPSSKIITTSNLIYIPQALSIDILSYIMHKYGICMLEGYKIDLWLIGKIRMRVKPNIIILEGILEI